MSELTSIVVGCEEFFISFSFDIDDFVGDGIWWLQIYDGHRKLIYDEPFINSNSRKEMQKVKKIIRKEFLTSKGAIL